MREIHCFSLQLWESLGVKGCFIWCIYRDECVAMSYHVVGIFRWMNRDGWVKHYQWGVSLASTLIQLYHSSYWICIIDFRTFRFTTKKKTIGTFLSKLILLLSGTSWPNGKDGLLPTPRLRVRTLPEGTTSWCLWTPHTDMGPCFRAHLHTRREGLSVGCTSPWRLVWALP